MDTPQAFAVIPVGFYDFARARRGSPLLRVLGFKRYARSLCDLHLRMVIYSKTYHSHGFVPDYEIGYLALPDSQAVAKRAVLRLVEAGWAEVAPGGYYVPAAEEWPPLWRTGTRDPISDYTRNRVYRRDDYRCVNCGSKENLTLDHIIPWSEFGPDSEDNLRTYCLSCNCARGKKAAV